MNCIQNDTGHNNFVLYFIFHDFGINPGLRCNGRNEDE